MRALALLAALLSLSAAVVNPVDPVPYAGDPDVVFEINYNGAPDAEIYGADACDRMALVESRRLRAGGLPYVSRCVRS